ncbi:NADP-dependent oxidoreductase [Zavarzinia sp. CC-PAN008]|uniref:NADP-dependent oxidoreductase n=1 Tax=Zavarzinia sp. CC-PAN008 TaxID=3243332 RepID=UPI003F7448FC
MARTNRRWLLAERPTGMVGPEHFRFDQVPVESPGPGQVLVRSLWLSLDPANRAWLAPTPTYKSAVQPDEVMHGFALGRVEESGDPRLAPGDIVSGMLGWQDYATLPVAEVHKEPAGRDPRHAMGVLGVTGLTAYFGLLEVGQPKVGETVVVSAAGGAVGSIVGQLAKLAGCRVVGLAGGPEKCRWLEQELGFDVAIDYRAGNLRRAMKAACPDGIDVYFDNVGGDILATALFLMNERGRIVACGNLSQYNAERPAPGPMGVPGLVVVKRLRIEGFIVTDYYDRRAAAEAALTRLLASGQLKAVEDVVEGLEKAPATLVELFQGRNRGKLLIKVA